MSPSSRRAWIEIYGYAHRCPESRVALLAEGVDRNLFRRWLYSSAAVALLAEGVDRNNIKTVDLPVTKGVALLAEGVDRNTMTAIGITGTLGRPPRGGRG